MNQPKSGIRTFLENKGKSWEAHDIPLEAFVLIGSVVIDSMVPLISKPKEIEDGTNAQSLAFLYQEAMQFALYAPLQVHNLKKEAEEFYKEVGVELSWSPAVLEQRLFEVKAEIALTGEYTHTAQELEIGARLAWRNSAKCIGR